MIRLICIAAILILFLILTIPVLFIEWIYGKFNPKKAAYQQLRIVQGAFKVMLFLSGIELVVIGEENIPKDEPVLYVGNHTSYFDILITYSRCPRLTGYVAKDSMEKVPLLSIWMKRLQCLFLNRDNIKEGLKTILKGIEQIKDGTSMCIFPEGTRNTGSQLELLPFKEGSLKMAEKSGCAIQLMCLNNSAEIFENHFPKIKPCKVILEYLPPIYPKELAGDDKKFLGAYCQNKILETIKKNQELLSLSH